MTNKKIVITGNIGSGKSTVVDIFRDHKYFVIDSDKISDKILRENHQVVSKMFSMRPQRYDSFKKELGKRFFEDSAVKQRLEDFMLPKIKVSVNSYVESCIATGTKFVIESSTFFEVNGLMKHDDYFVIMVHADEVVRMERILKRNPHLTQEDVINRMRAQINPIDKYDYCDAVIWNEGNKIELLEETLRVLRLVQG